MTSPPAPPDGARVAAVVDPHFDRSLAAEPAPGIAYALLHQGAVLHSRGIGTTTVANPSVPTADTGFRIASMTKSFTATTVLSLRDAGLLSLDTPVVEWVPELAGGGPDAGAITVRHLLTMGAGFVTDDPWGDRQQALPVEEFRVLLQRGVVPVTKPGDRFEYSNTGYAILGLVIEAVSGLAYPDAVRRRVLEPLGLGSTGFSAGSVADMATGYVKRSDGWAEEPVAGVGAFAPMGGGISTISDLATWVGFLGRGTGGSVVSSVSLREMQRTQRLVAGAASDAGDAPTVTGYGFGLFEELGPRGRTVFHSGGYPGFGSHMRWHPASGLGIIALANGTYAPIYSVAAKALSDVVQQLGEETITPLPPLAGLDAAAAVVSDWLGASDPDGPEGRALRARWSDNVELDLPWRERLQALDHLRREHGRLREMPGSRERTEAGTTTWTMEGDRKVTDAHGVRQVVRVIVMVAPHDTTMIQSVTLRAVADTPRPATVSLS